MPKTDQERATHQRRFAFLDGVAALMVILASAKILFGTDWISDRTQEVPGQPAVQRSLPISLERSPQKGSDAAQATIVVFSDFQCPACARFAEQILPEVERRYLASGVARLFYKHLPLSSVHPFAVDAAIASECAHEQQKFWPFHDLAFRRQKELAPAALAAWGNDIGLEPKRFESCRRTASPETVTARGIEAKALGIRATPTIFVGRTTGRVLLQSERLVGAISADTLGAAIKRAATSERPAAVSPERK